MLEEKGGEKDGEKSWIWIRSAIVMGKKIKAHIVLMLQVMLHTYKDKVIVLLYAEPVAA